MDQIRSNPVEWSMGLSADGVPTMPFDVSGMVQPRSRPARFTRFVVGAPKVWRARSAGAADGFDHRPQSLFGADIARAQSAVQHPVKPQWAT